MKKQLKIYTFVFNSADDYTPGYWEIMVEGEAFGSGNVRTIGFYDDEPQALETLLKQYPNARVIK